MTPQERADGFKQAIAEAEARFGMTLRAGVQTNVRRCHDGASIIEADPFIEADPVPNWKPQTAVVPVIPPESDQPGEIADGDAAADPAA